MGAKFLCHKDAVLVKTVKETSCSKMTSHLTALCLLLTWWKNEIFEETDGFDCTNRKCACYTCKQIPQTNAMFKDSKI